MTSEPLCEPQCKPLRETLRDLYAAVAAALLVATAVVVGSGIEHRDGTLRVAWPPLLATWEPHVGPGTPAALAVAAAVVAYGPAVAARSPWRPLLLAGWGAAAAWTWSLALVDGWYRGIAEQLTTRNEYLPVVGRFHDIAAALRDFNHHILIDSPATGPRTSPAIPRVPPSPSSSSTGPGWAAGAGRAPSSSRSARPRRSRS